jgi:cytochrome c-type biogenesis protein CcmF
LGTPALAAAFAFAVAALGLCVTGAIKQRRDLSDAGLRAVVGAAVFTLVAAAALVTALFAHDFSIEYVAQYSSRSLPAPYLLTALWGGMDGSLLFWTSLLTVFSAIALSRARLRDTSLAAWAGATLSAIAG